MNDLINTILQNVLKVGGSLLVAKGLASDSQVADLIGGVVAAVGVVLEYFHHKSLAAAVPPATTVNPVK